MRMLVACAWCERIRLDRWVTAKVALRRLRTYEWAEPPTFSHGICDECLERLIRRREPSRTEAEAA